MTNRLAGANGPTRMTACAIRLVAVLGSAIAVSLIANATQAQVFAPGPGSSVPGSSVSGMRIGGAPPKAHGNVRIKGADIAGDTVEERAYGRNYDDSYLKPAIPNGRVARQPSTEERATKGRADLNGINAGRFARQGPNAIGRSEVTRGSGPRSGRAIIRQGTTRPQPAQARPAPRRR